MRRVIVAALAIGTLAASSPMPAVTRAVTVDGSARSMPRPAVVMLWATWCVSCAAEIKRVPALAQAAAPLPFATLAIDPAARARPALDRAGLPIAGAFADGRDPGTVLADWGGPGSALPLAVAIDRDGRVCGLKRGLLGTDQLKEWGRRCSR